MVEHANHYLSSGGADGHMYKLSQPGPPDLTVPSLLLTTIGRKSGEQFILPLFCGKTGNSYIVVGRRAATSRLLPQHPCQPGGRGAGRDREDEGAGEDRRRARAAVGKPARVLAAAGRLPEEKRARDGGALLDPAR